MGQVIGVSLGNPTVQTFGAGAGNAIGLAIGGGSNTNAGPWGIYQGYSTAPWYIGGSVGIGPSATGSANGTNGAFGSALRVWASGTEVGAAITGDANSSDILQTIQNGGANAFKVTSAGIANAQTGFQVAGAASSGSVLVGDGTKFVGGTVSSSGLATANKTVSKSASWENPATVDSYRITIVDPATAITLTRVGCSVPDGTSITINLRIVTESARYTGGTAALTSNLTCGTTGASSTTFSTSAVAAHNPVVLEVTAVSGSPTWGNVDVEYTVN